MLAKSKYSARRVEGSEDESSGDEEDNKNVHEKKKEKDEDLNPPEDNDPDIALLELDLFNTELGYELEAVQKIYHVAKDQAAMVNIIANGFDIYSADDAHFDGQLASPGAPQGIFFCSTLYDGDLPTITMYPRPPFGASLKGTKYPRVALALNDMGVAHEKYKLYLVKDPTKPKNQDKPTLHVHIAMIHADNMDAITWANGKLQLLGLDNSIFTYKEGDWHAPKLKQPKVGNVWTNIFLIPAPGDKLTLPLRTAELDFVEHF